MGRRRGGAQTGETERAKVRAEGCVETEDEALEERVYEKDLEPRYDMGRVSPAGTPTFGVTQSERNRRIFDHKEATTSFLLSKIKEEAGMWALASAKRLGEIILQFV
ncbi:hypothetical protein [Oryza sativa Japonica Group]|uniref:Uncharacterized protein P0041E11.12 n=1 Tax=Oryza sativa subsp. japonica TaxID=39947 RepID=Q5ZEL7_ORYSJ|nr:hypothetical protein [Oryza sativa Japonica Group]